jgi:hypothetical protein
MCSFGSVVLYHSRAVCNPASATAAAFAAVCRPLLCCQVMSVELLLAALEASGVDNAR